MQFIVLVDLLGYLLKKLDFIVLLSHNVTLIPYVIVFKFIHLAIITAVLLNS